MAAMTTPTELRFWWRDFKGGYERINGYVVKDQHNVYDAGDLFSHDIKNIYDIGDHYICTTNAWKLILYKRYEKPDAGNLS